MNILQINTADTKGGAGKVAYRLKLALERKGYDSSMIVSRKYSSDEDVALLRPYSNLRQRILKKLSYILADDLDFYGSDIILNNRLFKNADIIHFHNLHTYYFNISTFRKIAKIKPVVWTFHDMWPITAHCGHSFNDSVADGFFVCQSKDIYPPIAWHNERYLQHKKRTVYENSAFHIVVPSLWLKNKVEKSLLRSKPITLIYNGVDVDIFRQMDKQACRRELNLPLDKKIILFLAKRGQSNPWKGGSYADNVLNKFADTSDVFILDIGGDENKTTGKRRYISFIKDEGSLAKYYSASDILLYPSVADNCPLVVLEALACGLPVVAFNTGGIPELVQHKKTGYVAGYKDVEDLAEGLRFCLNGNLTEMSHQASSHARTNFSLETMTDKYIALYKSILGKN